MTDAEKVINWFEVCRVNELCSTDCPYWDASTNAECAQKMASDALSVIRELQSEVKRLNALLKEQQPKKPHYSVLRYLINGQVMMIDHPECPKCFENGFRLYEAEIEKGQKFCKRCGQAIDWSKDGD